MPGGMESERRRSTGQDHADEAVTVDVVRRRFEGFEWRRLSGEKRAAVVAVFRADAGGLPEFLFIHRAEDPRDPWSGHMAFPGGRVETTDESARAAALRETMEEVGLDLERHGREVGRLSDVTAVARGRRLGLVIEPFLFELGDDVQLSLNSEVQEVVWIPLSFFLDPNNRSSLAYDFEGRVYDLPCYRWHGRVVWGLTLRMLDELLEVTDGPSFTDWPDRRIR